MNSVNDIFRSLGPEYLQHYGNSMPKRHRKVIDAMIACRTESCGLALYQRNDAASPTNSIAPAVIATARPVNSTKPDSGFKNSSSANSPPTIFSLLLRSQELRPFIRKNQRAAYSALFKTSSEAIKKLAPDPHYIGADLPGFFGAFNLGTNLAVPSPYPLHRPRRRSLHYRWPLYPSRIDFYLPVKALSIIFKAKFRDQMKQAGLFDQIPSEVVDPLERRLPS